MLDTIIVFLCPGAFSIEVYTIFSHCPRSIIMEFFNFTMSFVVSLSIGSKIGAFYPSLLYKRFKTVI